VVLYTALLPCKTREALLLLLSSTPALQYESIYAGYRTARGIHPGMLRMAIFSIKIQHLLRLLGSM
jgi:hypothetical protein